MYIGANESAGFWPFIMNRFKNRGVQDILIACVNKLSGFSKAIKALFPKTEVHQCSIHQIRDSTCFASFKDVKANGGLKVCLYRTNGGEWSEGADVFLDFLRLRKELNQHVFKKQDKHCIAAL